MAFPVGCVFCSPRFSNLLREMANGKRGEWGGVGLGCGLSVIQVVRTKKVYDQFSDVFAPYAVSRCSLLLRLISPQIDPSFVCGPTWEVLLEKMGNGWRLLRNMDSV